VFTFLWQFVIPLIVFVVAYWKILGVIRRQMNVAADWDRAATTSTEPVAGTSRMTDGENQRDEGINKGTVRAGSRGHDQVKVQMNESTTLSRARINVVRTMIYITVCFTVCWMPLYCVVMTRRLTVG